jgi:hypothetical protein
MTELYPYQKEGVELIRGFNGRALLSDQMGLGKAQTIKTPILTSNGWIPIGNIKKGDFIYGGNAEPCIVTGVYPQGKKQVNRVWFDDVYIDCCSEHLWKIQNTLHNPKIVETSELIQYINDPVWKVPKVIPALYSKHALVEEYRKTITNVEVLDDKEEMVCISVDSLDHCYITDHFIVTHNTIQAITYIIEDNLYPAVIVTPATLKLTWKNEFWQHYKKRVEVLSGGKSYPLRKDGQRIYIINYDVLHKWIPYLKALKPAINCFDESHYLKNKTSIRTKAAKELVKSCEKVLMLTGTPMMNSTLELYPLLSMILGRENIESEKAFSNKYARMILTNYGWKYKEAKNLSELNIRLKKSCMIRRLVADVLHDLPDKVRQTIAVSLPPDRMQEYLEMQVAFDTWYKNNYPDRAAASKAKSNILSKLGYMKREVAKWKLPFIFEWIDNFFEENPEDKLVVFGLHNAVLFPIIERYLSKGTKRNPFVVYIGGSVDIKDRQKAIDLFQTNPGTKLFIGQMKAAGVGVTLTAANHVLLAECDFVPAIMTQSESRLHRITQKSVVFCHYLVADRTIESWVCEMVQRKQQECDGAIDGKEVEDFSLLEMVIDRMRLNSK